MARTAGSAIAIARVGDQVHFVSDARGAAAKSGAFPSNAAVADHVVIADYSLITLPHAHLVRAAASGKLGLLEPRETDPELLDPQTIARLWSETPVRSRTLFPLNRITELSRFVEARSRIVAALKQALESIKHHLSAVSPEYLELFSENGRIVPHFLPTLRGYPTPHHLQSAGLIQVTRMLQTNVDLGQQRVDRLIKLHQDQAGKESDPADIRYAERMIQNEIDRHLMLETQRLQIDRDIYQVARRELAPAYALKPAERLRSLLSMPVRSDFISDTPERTTLIVQLKDLFARRTSPERQARSDYQEYLRVRAGLESCRVDLTPAESLRLETTGQLLALSAGEFLNAVNYRTACEQLLNAGHSLETRDRADAAIALALTEVMAVEAVPGFTTLHGIVMSDLVKAATPELLTEGLGMFYLLLVLWGEHGGANGVRAQTRALIEEHGGIGASRAPP